jgi:hypothetical protein
MATCSNCKANLSCGCQKRVASDKTSVCSNCLSKYEASLKTSTVKPAPTSNHIWGANRYKK